MWGCSGKGRSVGGGGELQAALRELFLSEVTDDGGEVKDVKVEVICRMCGVSLGDLTAASLSGDQVGVVLKAFLCSPQRSSEATRSSLLLCGGCGGSLRSLVDLWMELEELRRRFVELRRRVGRQVIVEALGMEEEAWVSWDAELSRVEEQFPSTVLEEENVGAGAGGAACLSVEVKEEPMEDFGGESEFMFDPLGGLETEEEDLKLNQMKPVVVLQRLTPTIGRRRPIKLGGKWEEAVWAKLGNEDTSEEEEVSPPLRLLRKRTSTHTKDLQGEEESSSSDDNDNIPPPPKNKPLNTELKSLGEDCASSSNPSVASVAPKKKRSRCRYTRYPCTLCTRLFFRPENLRRHGMLIHGLFKESLLPCSHCDATCTNATLLKSHLISTHCLSTPDDLHCQFCLKAFSDQKRLDVHQKLLHLKDGSQSPQNIRCFFCTNLPPFSSSAEMTTHAESAEHIARAQSKVSVYCNLCRINFRGDTEALQTHLKEAPHLEELKRLENVDMSNYCVVCRLNFDNPRDLFNHKTKSSHVKACRFRNDAHLKVPLKCALCPKEFDLHRKLDRHMATFHAHKGYTCKFCEATFTAWNDFHRHKTSHSSQIPKDAICEKCGKSFEHHYNLLRHLKRAHEGDPTPCELCGKNLPTPISLREHLRNVHLMGTGKDEGFYASVCPHCDASFKFSQAFRKHLHDAHPEETLGEDKKACAVCYHVFPSEGEEFETHMACHAHLRCSFCGKYYLTKYSLGVHMRKHTGEKPFECHLCDMKYAWKKSLKGHIAEKHPSSTDTKGQETDAS